VIDKLHAEHEHAYSSWISMIHFKINKTVTDHRLCEDRMWQQICSWADIHTQTQRQTHTVITILHFPYKGQSNNISVIAEVYILLILKTAVYP